MRIKFKWQKAREQVRASSDEESSTDVGTGSLASQSIGRMKPRLRFFIASLFIYRPGEAVKGGGGPGGGAVAISVSVHPLPPIVLHWQLWQQSMIAIARNSKEFNESTRSRSARGAFRWHEPQHGDAGKHLEREPHVQRQHQRVCLRPPAIFWFLRVFPAPIPFAT